ncbi:MAG: MgtC/SapB family protein [Proteobacteria bacterium]|nr:MgtC/SapB family protein [Pseudomonadota bacterium]
MPQWVTEFLAPLAAALVGGALIGLERGLRSEPAGFRTHALVCLASAALVLAARNAGSVAADAGAASRIAQGIVTGVGFLGAGMIFRAGLNIHGLTTAAAVWASASLGVMLGFGHYVGGGLTLLLSLVILTALKPLDERLPRKGLAEVSVTYRQGAALSEAEFRELLKGFGVDAGAIRHNLDEGRLTHITHIRARGLAPTGLLSDALRNHPAVAGFDIDPRDV